MEGLATLSLACNIIQLIECGAAAIRIIKQVYQDGKTSDNTSIEAATERLRGICQTIASQTKSTALEQQLWKTIQDTTNIADELIQELSKLKGDGTPWNKLKIGVVAVRKKSKIENLRQRLDNSERAVNTGILATLREQNEASKVMQERLFPDLDVKLQTFIVRLALGQNQTRDLIKAGNEETKALVRQTNDVVASRFDSLAISRQRDLLLNSLRYPEMNARLNQIEDASPDTFEPFFDPNSDHILSRWFREDMGLLWIQGKAGSGKSTLMKFIVEAKEVRDLIGTRFVMLKHFFWLSGAESQRNLHGLLCSLVYQLVGYVDIKPGDKQRPHDWSIKELESTILTSVKSLAAKTTTHLFLDALDEYEEKYDRRKLTNLICKLSEHARICVTSRPEPFWIKKFQHENQVVLEDITRAALMTYAKQEFEIAGITYAKAFAHQLTDRANGVFLWVHIAVKDVLRGLDSHASEQELQLRIDRLPRGMEDLYISMLERVAEDWPLVRQEAAILFSTALLLSEMSKVTGFGMGHMMLYQFDAVMRTILPGNQGAPTFSSLKEDCMRLRDRINFVCAGMLETRMIQRRDEHKPVANFLVKVTFSHRTVRDFLLDTPFGRDLTYVENWDRVTVICELIKCEYHVFRLQERIIDWSFFKYMIESTVHPQDDWRWQEEDRSRIVLAVREVLVQRLLPQLQNSGQRVEFVNRSRLPSSSWYPDDPFHMDFLGLTLEVDTMCCINSLDLALDQVSVQYMEYLLYCAALGAYHSTDPGGTAFYSLTKTFAQYGASGLSPQWVEPSLRRPRVWARQTAHERCLADTFEAISDRKPEIDDGIDWRDASAMNSKKLTAYLELLGGSLLDAQAIYYFLANTGDRIITPYDIPSYTRDRFYLFVEGNLKFWISLAVAYTRISHPEKFTMKISGYDSVTPFRRLRFVTRSRGDRVVPIWRKHRLFTVEEDGEALLQLWEMSMMEMHDNTRLCSFTDQATKSMNREAARLLQSISSRLADRDTKQSSESYHVKDSHQRMDDTVYMSIVDYGLEEGFLRMREEGDRNHDIPVFKE